MSAKVEEFRQRLRAELPFLAERYGVSYLGIFGSYLRGEERTDSDLDVLVSLSKPLSLLDLVGMENYLSDQLGIKVDVAIRESLRKHIGKNILSEVSSV